MSAAQQEKNSMKVQQTQSYIRIVGENNESGGKRNIQKQK